MVDRETIIQGAKIELARREFFFYCNLKAPDFYKENRKYLVDLCREFQEFLESDEEVLVVNEPPRHGKSRTAGLFVDIRKRPYKKDYDRILQRDAIHHVLQERPQ